MKYLYDLTEENPTLVGNKASALAKLYKLGLPIPPWVVVPADIFLDSLTPDQQRFYEKLTNLPTVCPTELGVFRDSLQSVRLSQKIFAELLLSLQNAGLANTLWAIRSSGVEEDSEQFSFAGQLDSFLFVDVQQLADRIVSVWKSAFSKRVVQYRYEYNLSLSSVPAVIVQQMIRADVSGVTFTADPVSCDRDKIIVNAVYGLGQGMVSGELDADHYVLDKSSLIISQKITNKFSALGFDGDAADRLAYQQVSRERSLQPTLSADTLTQVANIAQKCARHFDCPQDIEWAIADGKIYLLQARPITCINQPVSTSKSVAQQDGSKLSTSKYANEPGVNLDRIHIWDNHNIAESYSGITMPLTFSFALNAYEHVYRQFCRLMHVPEHRIAAHAYIYSRMLGLLNGRVYYNLISWYRLLALLPGYKMNQKFMEQMMGVTDSLSEDLEEATSPVVSWCERVSDTMGFCGMLFGLFANFCLLNRTTDGFYRRLSQILEQNLPDLTRMSANTLVNYYRTLEVKLLNRWDAPIINDFFTMIFYGLLRKLCQKWCSDIDGTLQNDLTSAEGTIVSAEPVREIQVMAKIVAQYPGLAGLLIEKSSKEITSLIGDFPDLQNYLANYLQKYGDRCLEELKLESLSLNDDPTTLYRSIGRLAFCLAAGRRAPNRDDAGVRANAEKLALNRIEVSTKVLGLAWLKKSIFSAVLSNARTRIRERENLRFERTRVFGQVRRIFAELGKRLHKLDVLEAPRDVFYLQISEILAFVEGTSLATDLKELIALRKRQWNEYALMPELPARVRTKGIVYTDQVLKQSVHEVSKSSKPTFLKGIGCSGGIVSGKVRLVTNPHNVDTEHGEILVAKRTDPGWVTLFANATGLLVEHGSLLSHSAIVARELGLPAIISIPDITKILKDGDVVELNGSTGKVRILSSSNTS